MAEQVPSAGRVVHYVKDGKHRPALVLDSRDGIHIALVAFLVPHEDLGAPFEWCDPCPYDPAPTEESSGCWHWPEYVPAK